MASTDCCCVLTVRKLVPLQLSCDTVLCTCAQHLRAPEVGTHSCGS